MRERLSGCVVWSAMTILCLGLMVTPGLAQMGRIRGVVVDTAGRPVGGATVRAENPEGRPSTLTTTTNGAGRFALLGLTAGRWTFTVLAEGFEPARGAGRVRAAGDSGSIRFVLNDDVVARSALRGGGVLGGVNTEELRADMEAAGALHDAGQYDEAIAAYEAILARVPALTTINLQIGHAHLEKKEYDQARAAYEKVLEDDPTNEEATDALSRVNLEGGNATPPRS